MVADAADDKPLDFEFIRTPPGQMVMLDSHRLHAHCRGEGEVTVLFEPGLGGSSLEWIPLQTSLQQHARVCLYDRAGYAWSDPSPYPRNARQLAREADQLLNILNLRGPLVLVGHSFGGFVVRMLAETRRDDMVGMVLVDASHEEQVARFEQLGGPSVLPKSGKSFVLSSVEVPENLPEDIRNKIRALGRMRKTYAATHNELSEFRVSARQVRQGRRVFDFPVIVLRRGQDPYADDNIGRQKAAIWTELQEDLTRISTAGELVDASNSGHHIHVDEPLLVTNTIQALIDHHESQ